MYGKMLYEFIIIIIIIITNMITINIIMFDILSKDLPSIGVLTMVIESALTSIEMIHPRLNTFVCRSTCYCIVFEFQ